MNGSTAKFDPLEPARISSLPPTFYYIPNFITAEEEVSILQKIPAQRWVTLSHRRLQAHPSTLTKNNTLLGAHLPPYLVNPVIDRFRTLEIFKDTPHKQPNHVLINEYKPGEGIMPHEDGGAYAHVVATVSLGAPICLEITQKPSSNETDGVSSNDQSIGSDEALAKVEDSTRNTTMEGEVQDVANTLNQQSVPQYKYPTRILQEPRSLLLTTGPAYRDLLHGISPVEVDEDLNAETVANWNLLAEPHVFEEAGGRNERGTRISLTYRDVLKVSSAANKVLGGLGKR
ncbi:hypothetical protein BDV95DRAFT_626116 [Massariosphaeria phaeospora]|uniref:Fe2OG dioxygenase domain-containing protein n=1 Tax=Massariosphaeria phaeospora TaxID=100035 RepID=A0A7C8IFI3_9PLEO|nr:hypothetical protein BDV95DRAFT_626116 [Massariosphaeria phaeospora]